MNKFSKFFLIFAGMSFVMASCTKDLDTVPIDKDVVTSAQVYENPKAYKQILAKIYAGLAVSGQQGPSGMPDISGIDEGFGQYLRGYWYHQELTTDEAIIGWNDQTIKDFHWQTWGAGDVFISAFYYRIFYQITLCNEFIRETTDAKLDERNVTGSLRTDIEHYRAEARFMRALSYYHALDMFGTVPFVTENDPVGSFFPPQISRQDLFEYIESELLEIEPLMIDARQNEYGRADKAAVWMLLAKLYLNSEVYTGVKHYDEVVTYTQRIIDAGYSLEPNYEYLFMADNDHNNEVIFSINFDGLRTQTWGGTTFLVHAAIGGKMDPMQYGVNGGWGGTRATKAFVYKFYPDATSSLRVSPNPNKKLKKADYPVIYVPGSYQDWDPTNTETVLASKLSDNTYEGYLYFPTANTEFKFTTGPNWDVNYGDVGADGTLELEGDNIVAAEPGYYKINVDMNALTYTIEKTDWGIIGDATPGGWDSDQMMTYDPTSKLWTITLDLTAGSFKFRANNAWDINLGDTGADGILDYGGDNILITQSGTYMISLKLGIPDYTYVIERTSYDHRAMFFTDGQSLEIDNIEDFTNGWAVTKWKNIKRDGTPGSDLNYVDTDFPMFRLADAYLMYAEAVLRGATNGSLSDALNYVNEVRKRAYGGETSGNITASQLTLDFILDERARELYWEGHRRTDLIRFGQFTDGSYVWPWKGKVPDGTKTSPHLNLFPIPSSDLGANPNLKQNSDLY
jgi:hypothetical protein